MYPCVYIYTARFITTMQDDDIRGADDDNVDINMLLTTTTIRVTTTTIRVKMRTRVRVMFMVWGIQYGCK